MMKSDTLQVFAEAEALNKKGPAATAISMFQQVFAIKLNVTQVHS